MQGRDAGKDAHLQLLRGELSELNRLVFRIRHGPPEDLPVRPKDLSCQDAKRDRRCAQKTSTEKMM